MPEIRILGQKIKIDPAGDYYGLAYWQRIEARQYEPDTISFLEANCNNQTDFMDIGAANGAMSIIASILGAQVSAYEPDDTIYRVFRRNLELNNELLSSVSLYNKALSDTNTVIQFNSETDASILSSIIFSNERISSGLVEVSSLVDEIDRFHEDLTRQIVIKMDIEGAEWRILSSRAVISSLNSHRAKLLLAVHPGFTKPIPRLANHFLITRIPWLVAQFVESVQLFTGINSYAEIQRTNGNTVSNKFKFALLIAAGYHEFVMAFGKHKKS